MFDCFCDFILCCENCCVYVWFVGFWCCICVVNWFVYWGCGCCVCLMNLVVYCLFWFICCVWGVVFIFCKLFFFMMICSLLSLDMSCANLEFVNFGLVFNVVVSLLFCFVVCVVMLVSGVCILLVCCCENLFVYLFCVALNFSF